MASGLGRSSLSRHPLSPHFFFFFFFLVQGAVSERFQSGFRAVASTDGYPMIPKHLRDSWRGANNGQVNPEKTGRWRERLQVKRDPELSTDGCQRHRIPKNVQESQKESLKMATGPFLPYPHDLSSSSSSSSSSFSGSPPPPPPPPFWCCGQATNRLVFIWCKVDQFCTSLSLSLQRCLIISIATGKNKCKPAAEIQPSISSRLHALNIPSFKFTDQPFIQFYHFFILKYIFSFSFFFFLLILSLYNEPPARN